MSLICFVVHIFILSHSMAVQARGLSGSPACFVRVF